MAEKKLGLCIFGAGAEFPLIPVSSGLERSVPGRTPSWLEVWMKGHPKQQRGMASVRLNPPQSRLCLALRDQESERSCQGASASESSVLQVTF